MKIEIKEENLSLKIDIKTRYDIEVVTATLRKALHDIQDKQTNHLYSKAIQEAQRTKEAKRHQQAAKGITKTKNPKTKNQNQKQDKGKKLQKYQGVNIYENIVNEMKDLDPSQRRPILKKYHPHVKKSTFKTYLNSYNRYIRRKINKPTTKEIAKKRKEQKWKELRGPIVAYHKNHPIYHNIYTEVKSLKRKGKLQTKNIKKAIEHFMPDASPNTIKAYATTYRQYALSPDEPNQRKYDIPTDRDKSKVQHALHTLFREDKTPNLYNILKEVDLTAAKTKLTLQELIIEHKVKKDNGNYYLKITG